VGNLVECRVVLMKWKKGESILGYVFSMVLHYQFARHVEDIVGNIAEFTHV
jgi:hypothetical protein